MSYYRRYYMQRDYAVKKPVFDATGSLTDVGEQLLLDEEWIKVDSVKLCECDDAEEGQVCECNTLTTNGTHCDSCIECGCDPEVCRCDCHKANKEMVDVNRYVKSKEFWRNRG